MSNKFLFSLAMTGLLVATAGADETTEVVATNVWFNATVPTTVEAANLSPWTTTEGCLVSISEGVAVDTEASKPLYYTCASQTADGYRIKARVKFTVNASVPSALPTINSNTARAGIMAAITSPGVTNWYGITGSPAAWNVLDGHTPVDGTDYDITVEFKTNATVNLVRYSIGNTVVSATGANKGWSQLGSKFNPTLFALAGCGTLKSLSADTMSYFELTVTAEDLTAKGISSENATSILADLNGKGANGLPRWESLVLGLDPTSETAKPYTAPVQTANGNIGFTIGNVNTDRYITSDATVSFEVEEYSDAACTERTATSSVSANAGSTAEVAAPDSVKYYKIKIKITK